MKDLSIQSQFDFIKNEEQLESLFKEDRRFDFTKLKNSISNDLQKKYFERTQVWISIYEVSPKKKLNAQTQASQKRQGALIKVQNAQGGAGFADLFCWPELGDLKLQDEITQQGELFKRSLYLAYKDLYLSRLKVLQSKSQTQTQNQTQNQTQILSQNLSPSQIQGPNQSQNKSQSQSQNEDSASVDFTWENNYLGLEQLENELEKILKSFSYEQNLKEDSQQLSFQNTQLLNPTNIQHLRTEHKRTLTVKLKADASFLQSDQIQNWRRLLKKVQMINETHQLEIELKTRFDFNFSLSEDEFTDFLNKLSEEEKESIDYIEDPFPFDQIKWQNFSNQIPLFLDWGTPEQKKQWPHKVLKLSREYLSDFLDVPKENEFQNSNITSLKKESSIIKLSFTSAMDHPISHLHSLRILSEWEQDFEKKNKIRERTLGFNTLNIYDWPQKSQSDFAQSLIKILMVKHINFVVINGLHFLNQNITSELLKKGQDLVWEPLFDLSDSSFALLSDPENQNDLIRLIKDFETQNEVVEMREKKNRNEHELQNHIHEFIYIPSSGSSQKKEETLKLYLHTKETLKNSALRVIHEFALTEHDHWGLVLPSYHVGGLGVILRSQLQKSKYFAEKWSSFKDLKDFKTWLEDNKIRALSLVPTQVFDLVHYQIQAPQNVKYVFIGSAQLSEHLIYEASRLGWPLILTYGMTETGSMIAYKKNLQDDFYTLMKGVSGDLKNLSCNSLAKGFIQYKNNNLIYEKINYKIDLNDDVLIENNKLKFFQRAQDYIKVKGVGVSLQNLRQEWETLCAQHFELMDLKQIYLSSYEESRDGEQVVLYVSENVFLKSEEQLLSQIRLFNQRLTSAQKIRAILKVPFLPLTDLGKVMFEKLKSQIIDIKII